MSDSDGEYGNDYEDEDDDVNHFINFNGLTFDFLNSTQQRNRRATKGKGKS